VKFPLNLDCQHCGKRISVDLPVDANDFQSPCPICGRSNSGFFGLEFTVGQRLMQRAFEEFDSRKDYSMTIIFAAMSVEAELSRYYFKWGEIDALTSNREPTNEELEESFRSFRLVREKIERVAQLMFNQGLAAFIKQDQEIADTIAGWKQIKSADSFAKDVEEALFWKRNRILHNAYGKYTEQDAKNAFSLAQLVLRVFVRMDLLRREDLEQYIHSR
jgi:hypothetical protein